MGIIIVKMDKFDHFKLSLPGVSGVDELCDLIVTLGLYRDERADVLYHRFLPYQVARPGGLWQDPFELATALWSMKDRLRAAGVRSFLEIGTFSGFTFFVVREFLRAFVMPPGEGDALCCATVDPSDHVSPDVRPHIASDIRTGWTSEDVRAAGQSYDVVFIDGCHEEPWPMRDYINLRNLSRVCILFHDVRDAWCPAVVKTYASLSSIEGAVHDEYTLHPAGDHFGIGVLWMPLPDEGMIV